MSTKTQRVLRITRLKAHYLVVDEESYILLREAKMTCMIFHRDMLPTIEMALGRVKARIEEQPFSDIYKARMSKVSAQWKSKQGRDCRFKSGRITFTCSASDANAKAINNLDANLRRFFDRWSFKYVSEFSEVGQRFKLTVQYEFMPQRGPTMNVVVEDCKKEYEFDLGFTRLKICLYDKERPESKGLIAPLGTLEVRSKSGAEWLPVYTGTFVNSTIGDLGPMASLVHELNRRVKL